MNIVQSNSVNSHNIPVTIHSQVLGAILGEKRGAEQQSGLNTLIECLIMNESSGREDVYGDSGKAFGILQFHRKTFDYFSDRYFLKLDYKNSQDQIILAKVMISEDIKNLSHWTTSTKCQ